MLTQDSLFTSTAIVHIRIFVAACGWYILVSMQTVFMAKGRPLALAVNFVASIVWIVLLKNLLVDLDRFVLTYACGTLLGCAIGMKIAHREER